MLPLASASTFNTTYGCVPAEASFSFRNTRKLRPVRSDTSWSLSPPWLNSTFAPATAAPGAPVSNRNPPAPSGAPAAVTNPGMAVFCRNSTNQPCIAPGRTTVSVWAAAGLAPMRPSDAVNPRTAMSEVIRRAGFTHFSRLFREATTRRRRSIPQRSHKRTSVPSKPLFGSTGADALDSRHPQGSGHSPEALTTSTPWPIAAPTVKGSLQAERPFVPLSALVASKLNICPAVAKTDLSVRFRSLEPKFDPPNPPYFRGRVQPLLLCAPLSEGGRARGARLASQASNRPLMPLGNSPVRPRPYPPPSIGRACSGLAGASWTAVLRSLTARIPAGVRPAGPWDVSPPLQGAIVGDFQTQTSRSWYRSELPPSFQGGGTGSNPVGGARNRDSWSRGAVWSARRPVKPEAAGSNPVGTAGEPPRLAVPVG